MPSLRRARLVAGAVVAAIAVVAIIAGGARAEPPPLELEPPRGRQGYYQALGIFLYDAKQWDRGRSDSATQGGLLTLRLGQMLTRRWGLGLRIEMGRGGADGKTSATTGLGVEVQFNPLRDLAVYGGVGLGSGSLTDPKDIEDPSRGGYGSVYVLGASWDIFLTRRLTGGWSLAPTVMVRYLPSDSLSGLWLCGGIQISRWFGRPRKELVLPDGEAYK